MALVRQEPAARIAAKHRVSADAVSRHFAAHLTASVARVQAAAIDQAERDECRSIDVMAELQRAFDRVNRLFDACDSWLRDPDDSTRYDLGPRDQDVQVIYRELGPNGKPIQKRAPLSRLLAKLDDAGVDVERGEWRHADPRELILKTADRLHAQLELLAKLLGDLDERPQINVLVAPEWIQLRTTLLEALRPYPEARTAVLTALGTT